MNEIKRKLIRWLTILVLIGVALMPVATASSAQGTPPPPTPTPSDEFELAQAVKILLPDRAALNYLVENGWDLELICHTHLRKNEAQNCYSDSDCLQ